MASDIELYSRVYSHQLRRVSLINGLGFTGRSFDDGELWFWFLRVTLERRGCILTDGFSILANTIFPASRGAGVAARCEMSPGKQPAAVQRQPHPDPSKAVAPQRQPKKTAISKSERYREILAVLARHGIVVVDDRFIKHEAGNRARAEHLRLACEELGTMFIKLGQMLSTRSDLLPEEYRTQDEVAPLPANAIADAIEEDLGGPPDKLFAFFDVKPLGSASIGQVHATRLFDGRNGVLKVRKPGVDELVRIDLEILEGLVEEWTPRFPIFQQYDARGLARDFSDALLAELDYSREAANVKFSPSQAFGPDFVLSLSGCSRTDIPARSHGSSRAEQGDI